MQIVSMSEDCVSAAATQSDYYKQNCTDRYYFNSEIYSKVIVGNATEVKALSKKACKMLKLLPIEGWDLHNRPERLYAVLDDIPGGAAGYRRMKLAVGKGCQLASQIMTTTDHVFERQGEVVFSEQMKNHFDAMDWDPTAETKSLSQLRGKQDCIRIQFLSDLLIS